LTWRRKEKAKAAGAAEISRDAKVPGFLRIGMAVPGKNRKEMGFARLFATIAIHLASCHFYLETSIWRQQGTTQEQ